MPGGGGDGALDAESTQGRRGEGRPRGRRERERRSTVLKQNNCNSSCLQLGQDCREDGGSRVMRRRLQGVRPPGDGDSPEGGEGAEVSGPKRSQSEIFASRPGLPNKRSSFNKARSTERVIGGGRSGWGLGHRHYQPRPDSRCQYPKTLSYSATHGM